MEQYSHNLRNDFVSLVRRCPIPDLAWVAGWRLAYQFRFACQQRRLKAYFRGLALFLKALPETPRSRAPVRVTSFRAFLRLKRAGHY